MRKFVFFSVLCLFSTNVFAEYEELQSIEKLSRERLSEYVDKLKDNKSLTGSVNLALALQGAFDSNSFSEKDIPKITWENVNYWRAAMEKTPRDSSVLYANAYLDATFGEIAYSDICFLLGSINVDEAIKKELNSFKEIRDKLYIRLADEISEGIKLHDEGQYEKAIKIYDRAIAEYPGGALFYYERGLSYMIESKSKNDPNLMVKALDSYKICREKDPFFWKAYQGNDPNIINKQKILLEKVIPFYSGEKRDTESYKAFAEGCEEMELYPFAAHARLKLSLIDPKNSKEHLEKFFNLIEESGCKEGNNLRVIFALSMEMKRQQQEAQEKNNQDPNNTKENNN